MMVRLRGSLKVARRVWARAAEWEPDWGGSKVDQMAGWWGNPQVDRWDEK